MSRIVYLNGAFVPETEAKLPIFDRGLLFADAVYEGLGVLDGQIIDFPKHMARLRRSLGELSIAEPMAQDEFFAVLTELIERNRVDEGFLYLHVTRGTADRDYLYDADLTPNVFAFTQDHPEQRADDVPVVLKMAASPDLRWARQDIKTTNLLGQVLAKTAAKQAGADEVLMVDSDGFVTEGGATSFFIVKDDAIIARPVTNEILHRITRQSMLAVTEELGLAIEHKKLKLEAIYEADEVFVTGSSSYVDPVGEIDGHKIGDGTPGPVTLRLRTEYLKTARATFYQPG